MLKSIYNALYFVFDSLQCCLGTVGNLLGLQQSYCMTKIAIPHTTYLKDNLIQQYRFQGTDMAVNALLPPLLCCAQIMRWDGCFAGLFTDGCSLLLPQWLIDLIKTFYKAEKDGVGCHISCLHALSVWFSGVLQTRTSSCSQLNLNILSAQQQLSSRASK